MRRWKTLKSRKEWRAERGALEKQEKRDYATVHARSGGQCEVIIGTRCRRSRMPGVHHVTKRSQGGKFKGPDYLMDICRPHHDLADNAHPGQRTMIDGAWAHGRLRISALGQGRFRCWMETTTKRAAPARRLPQSPFVVEHAPKVPERSEAS